MVEMRDCETLEAFAKAVLDNFQNELLLYEFFALDRNACNAFTLFVVCVLSQATHTYSSGCCCMLDS